VRSAGSVSSASSARSASSASSDGSVRSSEKSLLVATIARTTGMRSSDDPHHLAILYRTLEQLQRAQAAADRPRTPYVAPRRAPQQPDDFQRACRHLLRLEIDGVALPQQAHWQPYRLAAEWLNEQLLAAGASDKYEVSEQASALAVYRVWRKRQTPPTRNCYSALRIAAEHAKEEAKRARRRYDEAMAECAALEQAGRDADEAEERRRLVGAREQEERIREAENRALWAARMRHVDCCLLAAQGRLEQRRVDRERKAQQQQAALEFEQAIAARVAYANAALHRRSSLEEKIEAANAALRALRQ